MRRGLSLAIISLITLGFAVGAAQAITIPIPVVNGSFETPIVGGIYDTYNGPNNTTSLPGWTIQGSIDHIGSYWQAADGSESLDMAGSPPSGTPLFTTSVAGTIQQTFYIAGAGTATVNFW